MHHIAKWHRKNNQYQPTLYGIDDLLNEMFGQMNDFTPEFLNTPHRRRLELEVGKENVTASLAAPGSKPEDISVEVLGDYLTVKIARNSESVPEEGRHYIRRERSFESYEETVRIPVKVRGTEAKAKCDDGVLTITLPREITVKPVSHVVAVQ